MIRILVAVLLVAISQAAVADGKSDTKLLKTIKKELQAQTEILTQIEENTASQGNGAAVVPLRALWTIEGPGSCHAHLSSSIPVAVWLSTELPCGLRQT